HAWESHQKSAGEDDPKTATSMVSLATVYFYEHKFSEAEVLAAKALSVLRRVNGDEHPNNLTAIGSAAAVYQQEGKYAQAEPLYIESLNTRLRVLGEEHPLTLSNMVNLGSL